MTNQRWQQARSLCRRALECDPRDREAFLARACANDPDLLREARTLLKRATTSDGIPDAPVWQELEIAADAPTHYEGLPSTSARGGDPVAIGRYRHLRRIGRGAMGTVYRAQDPVIGRTVAIKVLLVDDDELRTRFQQEVRAAGTLTHQHIVAIYDYGEADGRPFIVMEHVEGCTLADRLHDPVRLTLPETVRLVQQLCAAIDYAHQHGVVHRDIKPANLMLDGHGDLKVVDFGIAKLGVGHLTRVGGLLGTLMYMSPEQVDGGDVDYRSDIFAVGLVLYELLTARPAFHGDTASQLIRAILHEQPVELTHRVPGLDPQWNRIVRTALQKEPARRYQTLGQLAADVGRISAPVAPIPDAPASTATLVIDRRVSADRPESAPPAANHGAAGDGRAPARRRLAISALVFAASLAVGAAVWFASQRRPLDVAPVTPTPGASTTIAATSPAAGPPDGKTKDGDESLVPKPPGVAATPPPVEDPVEKGPKKVPPRLTPFERARALLAGSPTAEQKLVAVGLLRDACDGGETAACLQGGLLYKDDTALRNFTLAAQLFHRACERRNQEGCNHLGFEYFRGVGVAKDDNRAATLFAEACAAGVPAACTNLGRAYQAGRGVPQDAASARAMFLKACDGGGLLGCVDGGVLLVRGIGGPPDPAGAVEMFQRGCNAGIPAGCADLALAYLRGDGVVKDEGRAVELLQRACDTGGMPACNNLAGMYITGRGVGRDPARAAALLERACQGDYAEACETLAQRYESGVGVDRNLTRAAEFARRATQLRGGQSSGPSRRGRTGSAGAAAGGSTNEP